MPRDATATRAALLRAAEVRFARDGVAGARMRDVVRDAGQANDQAVGYHFGSRDGLLAAVVGRHVAAMDAQRTLPGATATLGDVVAAIVEPTAACLHTADGRDFLRITEQLAGYAGLREGGLTSALDGTVLADQLHLLLVLLRARLGKARARERAAALVTFLTASLADRARLVESGARRPGHPAYVEDLVAMLTAAVSA